MKRHRPTQLAWIIEHKGKQLLLYFGGGGRGWQVSRIEGFQEEAKSDSFQFTNQTHSLIRPDTFNYLHLVYSNQHIFVSTAEDQKGSIHTERQH